MNRIAKAKGNFMKDLKEALDRYVETGELHGGFLTAVLENDLREAVSRADLNNQRNLPLIVEYCVNKLPNLCWGSKKRVAEWIDKGGLAGIEEGIEESFKV